MADFKFYLNRQGVRGAKGEKGDKGFSPSIEVGKNTQEEFTLMIVNEDGTVETPNIKEGLVPEDRGGTYVRKDPTTGLQYYGSADLGTVDNIGEVQLASTQDLENTQIGDVESNGQPAKGKAVDGLAAVEFFASNKNLSTVSQEVQNLSTEIGSIKNEQAKQDTEIQSNASDIANLNIDVNNLKTNKQNKLKAGANITLTDNPDGTTTVASTGGGGGTGGDVTAAGDNTFTGSNTFTSTTTFNAPIAVSSGGSTIETSFNEQTSTYIDLKVNSQADLILGAGTVVIEEADGTTYIRDGRIKDASGNILLSQGNVTAGDNITVEKTATGVKVSSTGGGGSDVPIATTQVAGKVKPDGETITVTSDGTISSVSKDVTPIATTSTVGKVKPDGTTITITDDGTISAANGGGLTPDENDRVTLEGINLKQHNLSNPSGSIYASSGNIEIRNQNDGGMILDSYGGLYKRKPQGIQSELIDSSMNPAFTTKVNFFNNDQIIHSNNGLKFGLNQNEPMGSITASYGTMHLNPDKISSPSAELTISSSTLTYTDRDGNTHNLLESGGGGGTPANMVTTDTDQDITGAKRFLSNRQDLSKPAIKIGSYAAGQDNYDGGYITTGIANLEIGDYYATNSKGGFLSISSTADSSIFKITSDNSNINPRLQLGTYNYEGEIYNDIAEGLCLSNHKYDYNGQRSILKIKNDTLTFKKTDGTVVDLLNNSSKEQYGIRADYALTHGIVDNPNGIISYNGTDKNITVKQGLVLKTAGTNVSKTTIASDIQHTVTSTGDFTLFYANGELLECGQVDYSTEEPTNNGVTNYQAWFNPDKTVNANQQWQFKSNDTGNVWRYVDNSTPLADIVADSTAITSVSYLGYRVFDDDIFAHKSEWVYKTQVLINNVAAVNDDVTIDLSEYLPNDGYDYEIMLDVGSTPTASTVSKFVHTRLLTNKLGQPVSVLQARTTVANVDATEIGSCILPIDSTSKSVIMKGTKSTNLGGTRKITVLAYRRINY